MTFADLYAITEIGLLFLIVGLLFRITFAVDRLEDDRDHDHDREDAP